MRLDSELLSDTNYRRRLALSLGAISSLAMVGLGLLAWLVKRWL